LVREGKQLNGGSLTHLCDLVGAVGWPASSTRLAGSTRRLLEPNFAWRRRLASLHDPPRCPCSWPRPPLCSPSAPTHATSRIFSYPNLDHKRHHRSCLHQSGQREERRQRERWRGADGRWLRTAGRSGSTAAAAAAWRRVDLDRRSGGGLGFGGRGNFGRWGGGLAWRARR